MFCESSHQSCRSTNNQTTASPSTLASIPDAGLVSQFFDLRGPSVAVRNGCSTGLSTFNLAFQSVIDQESDIAIVVAANPIAERPGPTSAAPRHELYQGMEPPPRKEGCFPTKSRPSRYRFGERAVALVLKSYDAAVHDGDAVRAVIRGSASDSRGDTTATESQLKALIKSCYVKAGIDPLDTDYVESLQAGIWNDESAEMRALKSTFALDGERKNPVVFGSASPGIGHSEPVLWPLTIVKIIKGFENGLVPPGAVMETAKQGDVKVRDARPCSYTAAYVTEINKGPIMAIIPISKGVHQ